MGSRTPDHTYQDRKDGENIANSGGEPSGSHLSRDGDGCLGDGAAADDSDDDAEAGVAPLDATTSPSTATEAQKKKKKKKKSKKKKTPLQQSWPPRVPLAHIYPSGDYPEGEIQHYTKIATSTAEQRYLARIHEQSDENFLKNYRKAAEVHRQARKWAQEFAKPGQTLLNIAEGIEDTVRALLANSGLETGDCLKSGMGFPTGLCLNNETAHYTPNPGHKDVVLKYEDVMKVDFGVHINGWIVDSAFTMHFDPIYDNLIAAAKDATNTGIRETGIDVRICDISAAIQEAMESYEVEIKGKTIPIKSVKNITAHNIAQWHIHAGKSIPFIKNKDQTKLEEGEVIAIETFGTTGRGWLDDDNGIYGYSLIQDAPLSVNLPLTSAKKLHKTIRENFSTIPFCRRYLERLGVERYLAGMNSLVSNGIVEAYKPLVDSEGAYTAQFEHTLLLREQHKEVLSRGDDY
ncbi:hypothetical protein AA313_de0206864 [Arthrobotrys entomopaga]|nr:hypothetical protein AA313_de0206864 [Arthrobotrys entomopaga]